MNGIAPNEFWAREERQRLQRLYFELCQFAAAVLDYATGLDISTREFRTAADTVTQPPMECGGQTHDTWELPSQPRLNWSATAFYYSLVHAGRFFVFVPIGDFPKGHDDLPHCFGCPKQGSSATTNWLGTFARRLDPAVSIQGQPVTIASLLGCWSESIRWGECERFFRWLGKTLERGRNLRNENNYESLLIAHEYNHQRMTQQFQQLADCMRGAAHQVLSHASKALGLHLRAGSAGSWDISPDDKLAFAASFLEKRVHHPVCKWYGNAIGKQIADILKEVDLLSGTDNHTRVSEIWRDVSWGVFDGKESLMRKFEEDIGSLCRTLSESG